MTNEYPEVNGKRTDIPKYCPICGARASEIGNINIRYRCGGRYFGFLTVPDNNDHSNDKLDWYGRCYNSNKAIEAGLDPTTPDNIVDDKRRELGLP